MTWRTIATRTYRQGRTGTLPTWDGDADQIRVSMRLCEINKLYVMTKRSTAEDARGLEFVTEELQVRERR